MNDTPSREDLMRFSGDLSKGVLPIMVVIALLVAVFWGGTTYQSVVGSSSATEKEIAKLGARIEAMQELLGKLQTSTILQIPVIDLVRKGDLDFFCYRIERANLDKGFKCPSSMGDGR